MWFLKKIQINGQKILTNHNGLHFFHFFGQSFELLCGKIFGMPITSDNDH